MPPAILRHKVLGQAYPNGGSLTTLYTVPSQASAWAVVSTISICNGGTEQTTFRVSIAVAGAADADKQYLYRDQKVNAGDTFVAALGIELANTDVVRVYSGNGLCSFQLFGQEAQ